MNTLAERLRATRIARGLTQAALARACGLSQSAIANYENGLRQSPKDILKLAHHLDVSPLWLAEGKRERLPSDAYNALLTTRLPVSDIPARLAPWPFQSISPDAYWALDTPTRSMIEATLSALIDALPDSGSDTK